MNGLLPARPRPWLQAVTLAVALAASAAEIWAVAGGLDGWRDGLLGLIALTMIVAAAWG